MVGEGGGVSADGMDGYAGVVQAQALRLLRIAPAQVAAVREIHTMHVCIRGLHKATPVVNSPPKVVRYSRNAWGRAVPVPLYMDWGQSSLTFPPL